MIRLPEQNPLVVSWRKRRREIIKTLSRDLFVEYRNLGIAIKAVLAEEAKALRKHPSAAVFKDFGLFPRTPLSVHKKKLVEFLGKNGPTTRSDIIKVTGIPAGSLSQLFSQKEFEQHERGFWALKGQAKKSDTPTPPTK